MTRKSPTVLVIALILTNVSWGHPTSAPEIPYVPIVACQTVQLQSENGKPVADVPVRLEEVGTFKAPKKLKTDAAGKIQFEELNPGSYILALPHAKKFGFLVGPKPGDCTQAFVLQDKGFMVEIELTAPKKLRIKNNATPQ